MQYSKVHKITLYRGFCEDPAGSDQIWIDGKWYTGRWLEGNLEGDPFWDRVYISGTNPQPCIEPLFKHAVIPESVCEAVRYLRDRKGRSIFEGDIIKHYNDKRDAKAYSTGVVKWDRTGCKWIRIDPMGRKYEMGSDCDYEVCGNIFADPARMAHFWGYADKEVQEDSNDAMEQ